MYKAQHPAHGTQPLQSERDGRVRGSALLTIISLSNLIKIDDQAGVSFDKLPNSGGNSANLTLRNLTQVKLARRGINFRNRYSIVVAQSTIYIFAKVPEVMNQIRTRIREVDLECSAHAMMTNV
jgi:hypothetical protein